MLALFVIVLFLGTTLLTRAYLEACPRWGLIDKPNQRSSHVVETPRGGGVVFVILVLGGGWVYFLIPDSGGFAAGFAVCSALGWTAIGALFIAVIGFLDDRLTLRATFRLALQGMIAIGAIVAVGWYGALNIPGLPTNDLSYLGFLLTLVWIVGMTNVYNFMDGIDGIAGVQGIATTLGWAGISLVFVHEPLLFAVNLFLAAGLTGFLVWNWHPARVFMGDVGSAFLGFVFALMPLVIMESEATIRRFSADLALAGGFMVWPFLFDGIFTFIRRALRRENVLLAHRTHLYQRLTKLGWSHRSVAILYGLWAFGSVFLTVVYLYASARGWFAVQLGVIGLLLGSGGTVVGLVTVLERRAMTKRFVYLGPPSHSSLELDFVTEAIRSNWIAPYGPDLDAFEREFGSYVGIGHAVGTASGTAALSLVLKALGIGPGDKVLASDFTFVATVTPILHVGAEPVLVDCDEETWNVPIARLKEAVSVLEKEDGRPPKAFILAHIYGICADLEPIVRFCADRGILLIEDAAEAVGSRYGDRYLGVMGRAGVFSFNGNKIMTAGGGGMLVSEDEDLAAKVKFLSTQAREPEAYYEHRELGYNERLSNILAAVGRAQLRRLPAFLRIKERHRQFYETVLADVPGVSFMPEPEWCSSNHWLTNVLVDPDRAGFSVADLYRALQAGHIESRPLWKPMHMQPLFRDRGTRVFGGEVGRKLFERGISLPSGVGMTDHDRDRVASVWMDLRKNV